MTLIAIPAHDISDAAGISVDRDLPPSWLDAELADASVHAREPGQVTARLSRTGKEIVVCGKVTASLDLPCARCLDPARYDVEGELALLLVPAPSAPAKPHAAHAAHKANGKAVIHAEPEEVELTAADTERDTFDGETVVLDPFVREAILLELPNFPLCSEACPGIRPAPAAAPSPEAERVDPRLAPLGALRARLAETNAKAGEKRAGSKTGGPPARKGSAPPKKKKTKE
jgi:uncharacterized protein